MQRENTRSGQKRDKKGFESEGRAGMLHQQRGWADERSSTVELCKRRVRRGSHSVGRSGISRRSRDATGRATPGVKAA